MSDRPDVPAGTDAGVRAGSDAGVPTAGHLPALVTPLVGGRVDHDTFARLVRRAFDHGSSAVLVAGSTGEGPFVPASTRAALVATAVEVAEGRSVLACVTGTSLDDVHADVERAAAAGASGVLALAPFYFRLTAEEHADAQVAIADRAAVPLLVYHIPQATRLRLTPDVVADLAGHANIAGMKDSSGDLDGLQGFVAAARGQRFGVFQGNGPRVLPALEAGAAGSITAIANVRPAVVAALHEAFGRDDRGAAAAAQEELTRVSAALDAAPGPLAAAIKVAMHLEDVLPDPACVPPLRGLPVSAVDELRAAIGVATG